LSGFLCIESCLRNDFRRFKAAADSNEGKSKRHAKCLCPHVFEARVSVSVKNEVIKYSLFVLLTLAFDGQYRLCFSGECRTGASEDAFAAFRIYGRHHVAPNSIIPDEVVGMRF